MKTWILPAVMTGVLAVLVTAVFSPDATRALVAIPKGWIEARQTASLKAETRAEWMETNRLARTGDADAMYRLGMNMLFWSHEDWTGVPTDPTRGEILIRRSADTGHLEAMLTAWRIDGKKPEDLVRIAARHVEQGADASSSGTLSDWLRWTALQDCHVAAKDAATNLFRILHMDDSAEPAARRRYESFLRTYEGRCVSE